MDLEGDLSWMHSYRVMWLTFMLGCGANEEQQKELNDRNAWVEAKKKKDPKFETTKLEWARKLGDDEIAVLDDPLKNYAQMGGGDLPPGAERTTLEAFLKACRDEMTAGGNELTEGHRAELKRLEELYTPDKGLLVKVANQNTSFWFSSHLWYPNREAPAEEVKGLSRLKGHLQKGQWLTKFRKILRKDEMTDDLVLVPVPAGKEQDYIRIMPTSPP
jgi:hypothetical protein